MKLIRVYLLLAAFFIGVSPLISAQQQSSSQSSASQEGSAKPADSGLAGSSLNSLDQMGIRKYKLGPGDVLDLRVFGEPQFSDKLQVTDEGNIEVPFIGSILARCRTDVEVKKDIVAALKKYLKDPQVSLRITEARSRPPAVVFGAVRAPQRVQMNRQAKLLELLAFAGGVTEQAGGMIQVFHTEPVMCPDEDGKTVVPGQQAPDDPTQVAYNLYNLADLKLGKEEANPEIRPGDIIIVQESAPVYVTGAVVSPQGVYHRGSLTLSRAIAQVGGLRREAKSSSIQIYRVKPGTQEQETITVDFNDIKKQKREDIALQPFDVVEVPDNSGSVSNIFRNFLTGTVATAATSFGGNMPLRVLY